MRRVHEAITGGNQGRPPQHAADILRSATVFLHATLEDLLRNLAEQYWPLAGPAGLAEVPLKGHRKLTHSLRDLVPHRQERVEDVLEASIHAYLQRATFDRIGEVRNHLTSLGLDINQVQGAFNDAKELIQRRHHIVHQADRAAGMGVHNTEPISRPAVRRWLAAVTTVGNSAMGLLP